MIKKILTLGCLAVFGMLFFLLALSVVASATDWTSTNPMGLGYTNNPAYTFLVTNNYASNGSIDNLFLGSNGFTSSTARIYNCNNCLYGMVNPVDNTVWGSDEQGNVFYTDQQFGNVNYALGFYSYPTNTNPLYLAATFSAQTIGIKLAFDSQGNVYSSDFGVVKKFVKSLGYSIQTLYTFPESGNLRILGIAADSSDNIHLFYSYSGGGVIKWEKNMVSSSGSLISTYRSASLGSPGVADIIGGGMVIDSANSTTNYTLAYIHQNGGKTLTHNSSSGSIEVSSLTGITSIGDIAYQNFLIYVSSPSQNLIRSYVTNYEGVVFSSGAPSNPSGITGTFAWLNGLGASVSSITPGAALAYKWTISNNDLTNYTFYSGWGYDAQTMPDQIRDLTSLTGLGTPAVFPTSSNTVAGTSIYGYLLAKRINDSSWSILATPVKLTISPPLAGFDSITLDKAFYNLTGDTVTATFTYKDGFPWIYEWNVCSRADCADGNIFTLAALTPGQATATFSTTGYPQGNYYAVMMKHLPFLQNTIVASQPFQIRPPVIGVSWDKTTYNLLPKSAVSSCQDSTPSTSYFTTILGYNGLQKGFFSCSSVPAAANANNSIMRGSLYAKYTGTFYLNNSLGSIWNGTLTNGSGSLIYVLTNTSPTETWTLTGVNTSGETFSANAQVNPEDRNAYTMTLTGSRGNPAYNAETLYLVWTHPIYTFTDKITLKDAAGQDLVSPLDCPLSKGSCQYYIDPQKQYTYGTWTAHIGGGGLLTSDGATATITVKNAGRPKTNASTIPVDQLPGGKTGSDIADLLSSNLFWAFVFTFGAMGAIAVMVTGKTGNTQDAMLPSVIVGFFGLSVFTWISWVPLAVWASIVLIAIVAFAWQRSQNVNTGGA